MITIEVEVAGLFAALRDPKYIAGLRRITRKAHKATIGDYMTRKKSPAFGDRFDFQRGARFRFSPRSEGYQRRQRKRFGKALPYVSPTRAGTKGAGHLRSIVTRPGRGHRITARNVPSPEVRTRLRLPAARILNLIKKPYGQRYRDEFLRFGHPSHQVDAKALNRQIGQALLKDQRTLFQRAERRALRASRRTIRSLQTGG